MVRLLLSCWICNADSAETLHLERREGVEGGEPMCETDSTRRKQDEIIGGDEQKRPSRVQHNTETVNNMCRETELEWHLGGAELESSLASLQPRMTGKELGREGGGVGEMTSPEKPKLIEARSPLIKKEQHQQQVAVNQIEAAVRPPFPRRISTFSSTSPSQPSRLLPFFPKAGLTAPPTAQSLGRSVDRLSQQYSKASPPSKATARNPLPGPASRASASSNASSSSAAGSPASKAGARNPSPAARQPAEKVSKATTASNPTPAAASRLTARNPSPTPGPRTAARSPSPTPPPRTSTARSASPTPAPRTSSTGRNPSPTPAPRTTTARNPSPTPASRTSTARNPSPTPAPRTSTSARTPSPGPATRATPVGSQAKNSLTNSGNGKTLASLRRAPSPAMSRKPAYDDNGRKIYSPESVQKPSIAMMASPSTSMNSSSGELSPRSALDVNKALRMSINRSLKKEGLGQGQWSPESPTSMYSPVRKLTPIELALQKKERIAGYGRKPGTPKSGRVACEGMLPESPVKTLDTNKRCHWVTPQSEPGLVSYHDEEWGVPEHDDKRLFEFLVLEGAQSELSRPQLLSMREYFRAVLGGFDPEIVAKFDEKRIMSLVLDDIIRQPEAKIRGVIDNARQLLKIREEFGSFDKYLWGFIGFKPIVNSVKIFTKVPVKSSKAETLSKDLMARGFRYVGPTTVYSFMQAAGMVNDHLLGCYRHDECCEISQMQAMGNKGAENDKKAC